MPRPSRPGVRGVTWYRIRIQLPDVLPPEPVFVPVGPLFPAYEIFANGKPIRHRAHKGEGRCSCDSGRDRSAK